MCILTVQFTPPTFCSIHLRVTKGGETLSELAILTHFIHKSNFLQTIPLFAMIASRFGLSVPSEGSPVKTTKNLPLLIESTD